MSLRASILPSHEVLVISSQSDKSEEVVELKRFMLALWTVLKADSLVTLQGVEESNCELKSAGRAYWPLAEALVRLRALCLLFSVVPTSCSTRKRGKEKLSQSTGSYSRLCLPGITPSSESADSWVKLGHLPTCSWLLT